MLHMNDINASLPGRKGKYRLIGWNMDRVFAIGDGDEHPNVRIGNDHVCPRNDRDALNSVKVVLHGLAKVLDINYPGAS